MERFNQIKYYFFFPFPTGKFFSKKCHNLTILYMGQSLSCGIGLKLAIDDRPLGTLKSISERARNLFRKALLWQLVQQFYQSKICLRRLLKLKDSFIKQCQNEFYVQTKNCLMLFIYLVRLNYYPMIDKFYEVLHLISSRISKTKQTLDESVSSYILVGQGLSHNGVKTILREYSYIMHLYFPEMF